MPETVEFCASVVSVDGTQIVIALFDGADMSNPCALLRSDAEAASALNRAIVQELRNLAERQRDGESLP